VYHLFDLSLVEIQRMSVVNYKVKPSHNIIQDKTSVTEVVTVFLVWTIFL